MIDIDAPGPAPNHRPERACRLTAREVRIASLLAAGASTAQVAGELLTSPHTVAAQLGGMLRKTGAANRTELIARLYAVGVLVPGHWPPLGESDTA